MLYAVHNFVFFCNKLLLKTVINFGSVILLCHVPNKFRIGGFCTLHQLFRILILLCGGISIDGELKRLEGIQIIISLAPGWSATHLPLVWSRLHNKTLNEWGDNFINIIIIIIKVKRIKKVHPSLLKHSKHRILLIKILRIALNKIPYFLI